MRSRWVVLIPAMAAGLVGCGSAVPAVTHGVVTAPPSVSSTPTTAPTPTPAPPPPPPPPLAILERGSSSSDASISAVDGTGHVQWTLTTAAVITLLSATPHDSITARVAGPNLILSRVPSQSQGGGSLVVLDRTGAKIGGGSFAPLSFIDDLFGSPTGTEWAWSVDDTSASAQLHHGRIMVAGIGVAAHSVFAWVAPLGSSYELVAGWTDMGIVMERISLGGCGAAFHSDTASFLVDPVSGALANLFTDGSHYGDARHKVRVAFAGRSGSAVIVNGTTFDEVKTVADSVYVSPDAARVGVQRFSLAGCAGVTPTLNTEMVDVAGGTHTDVSGCGITGWFDATDFVCRAFNDSTEKLDRIDGSTVAALGTGAFVGALSSG
jgi:hypothetical protein